jgi:hypothetical protein
LPVTFPVRHTLSKTLVFKRASLGHRRSHVGGFLPFAGTRSDDEVAPAPDLSRSRAGTGTFACPEGAAQDDRPADYANISGRLPRLPSKRGGRAFRKKKARICHRRSGPRRDKMEIPISLTGRSRKCNSKLFGRRGLRASWRLLFKFSEYHPNRERKPAAVDGANWRARRRYDLCCAVSKTPPSRKGLNCSALRSVVLLRKRRGVTRAAGV